MITKRLGVLEENQKKGSADIVSLTKRVDTIQENVEKSKEREVRIKSETMEAVFAEQRERKSRERNVVIHNIPEPDAKLKKPDERKEADKKEMLDLFEKIEAEVEEEDIRFFARAGEASDSSRPLVIGFKSTAAKAKVLGNASKLSDMENKLSDISIAHDLTKAQ